MAFAGLIICIGMLVIGKLKGASLLEFVYPFTGVYAIFFSLRAVVLMLFPDLVKYYYDWPANANYYLATAMALSLIGLFGFYAGYFNSWAVKLSRSIPIPKALNSNHRSDQSIAVLLFLLGTLGFVALFSIGAAIKFQGRGEDTSTGLASFLLLLTPLRLAGIFLVWSGIRSKEKRNLKLAILLVVIETMLGFISGSKRMGFEALIVAGFAYHFVLRRKLSSFITISAIIFLFIVFPFVSTYRELYAYRLGTNQTPEISDIMYILNSTFTEFTGQDISKSLTTRIIDVSNRATFIDPLTMIIYRVPNEVSFQDGRTFAPLLYGWIPRAVWPSKPQISYAGFMNQVIVQANTNAGLPLTPYGEFYLNFGAWAVPVGMALFGFLARVGTAYFLRWGKTSIYGYIFYVNFFFALILPGSFSVVFLGVIREFIFVSIVLILTLKWFDSQKRITGKYPTNIITPNSQIKYV